MQLQGAACNVFQMFQNPIFPFRFEFTIVFFSRRPTRSPAPTPHAPRPRATRPCTRHQRHAPDRRCRSSRKTESLGVVSRQPNSRADVRRAGRMRIASSWRLGVRPSCSARFFLRAPLARSARLASRPRNRLSVCPPGGLSVSPTCATPTPLARSSQVLFQQWRTDLLLPRKACCGARGCTVPALPCPACASIAGLSQR
jgi:hypothetical protein